MASSVLAFVYLSVGACVMTSCKSLHLPTFRNKHVIPSNPRSFSSRRYYSNTINDAISHYYGPPPTASFEFEDSKNHMSLRRTGPRRWERAFHNPKTVPETSHFLIVVPPIPGSNCPEGTRPDHTGQCRVPITVFIPTTPATKSHEPSDTPELVPEVVPEMATTSPTTTTSSSASTTTATSTTPSTTFRAKPCASTTNSAATVTPAPTMEPSAPAEPSGQETDMSVENSSHCTESTVEEAEHAKVDGEGKEDADGDGKGEDAAGVAGVPLSVLLLLRDMPTLLRVPAVDEKIGGKHDRDLKKVLESAKSGDTSLIDNIIEE